MRVPLLAHLIVLLVAVTSACVGTRRADPCSAATCEALQTQCSRELPGMPRVAYCRALPDAPAFDQAEFNAACVSECRRQALDLESNLAFVIECTVEGASACARVAGEEAFVRNERIDALLTRCEASIPADLVLPARKASCAEDCMTTMERCSRDCTDADGATYATCAACATTCSDTYAACLGACPRE